MSNARRARHAKGAIRSSSSGFEVPKTSNLGPRTLASARLSRQSRSAILRSSSGSELPLGLALRYSYCQEIGEAMITPDVLTEYLRQMMPDAAVTVSDRTGTMDHLKVVVISAAFAGRICWIGIV